MAYKGFQDRQPQVVIRLHNTLSGTELVSQEAKYYDIVGFGILAEVRAAVVPEKFAHAYTRLAASGENGLGAIQDRSLTPMALAARDSDDLDGDGDRPKPSAISPSAPCRSCTTVSASFRPTATSSPRWRSGPRSWRLVTWPPGTTAPSPRRAASSRTRGRSPTGTCPAGVELAPDGALTGVPALPGERTFAAQVRDAVGATAAGTFTVTVGGCDRTVTGTHRGSLTADTGVLCLDQADQYGDVVLTGDARLAVLGATLRGAVRASGSAAVTLCGTDVRGELNVAGTDGRILVDPSDCATSMVAGGQAPR